MERQSVPASLGEFLRGEREKRGVTIEQMVSATKISLKLVHALENDQYAELPAKPFVRGFVISYCRFLGLSSQEVLTRFSRYLNEKAEERPNRDAGHSGYAFEAKEGEGGRTGLWIVMGSMLLVGGIVVAVFKPSLKHHRKSHLEKLQAQGGPEVSVTPAIEVSPTSAAPAATATPVVVSVPSPSPSVSSLPVSQATPLVPSPTPQPSPVASATPEPSRKPDPLLAGKDLLKEEIRVKVVVKAAEDVWVRYQVDQKNRNRLILRTGVTLVLFAKDLVALQSSSPENTLITRSVGSPGKLVVREGTLLLSDLLAKSGDGNTLMSVAEGVEKMTSPFSGEAALGAPPARPQRPASEETPATP